MIKKKHDNVRNLQSLANLQFWAFSICHLTIWMWFVQTLGTSCIYTIIWIIVLYLLFFTVGTHTYTSKLNSVFQSVLIAF